MRPFVHLSVHTEYSLKDSIVRIGSLVSTAAEYEMPAVAVSDNSNLFSAVRFFNKATAAGVKPILSSEITVYDPDYGIGQITLICRNKEGYRNLCEIISAGYVGGRSTEFPVITFEDLKGKTGGLTALSGARRGHVGGALLACGGKKDDRIKLLARKYQDAFSGHFYLELQRTGHIEDNRCVEYSVRLAAEEAIPVVATNPVRFINPADARTHDVRAAIARGVNINQLEGSSLDKFTPDQYFKTGDQMAELFADIPIALDNTIAIAQSCTVDMDLGKNYLPKFPVPDGFDEAGFLESESRKGLEKRLDDIFEGKPEERAAKHKEYQDRLDYELSVINKMGFPGYFLIVSDFIRWSKANNIPVGPGRGSGAGSLVAYSLEITDLDPLKYDLLFERFLNPERVSMPDFDVDFCMDRRDEVIDYVARTYGRDAVSQIVTFGTMAAKMVVRDVARALGHPYLVGDRIAKMIPAKPGTKLSEVMETSLEFQTVYETDPDARAIIDHSLQLEGLTRQVGKHAGGVLISPTKLTDFTPVYAEEDGRGIVSQYDKDDVEAAGLVKFDFLGLRTLTIIQHAVEAINERNSRKGSPSLDVLKLPLDDVKTFDLLNRSETTAVFQLESQGMKALIHQLHPDNLEEIIALVALYRPGPLEAGMVKDFVNRKHGRAEVEYLHPLLEPILENTYGVFVYQEQVMQTAQSLAGYTLGEADMLRRAMGKKKPEEMAKQRQFFCDGAVKKGIDEGLAAEIFNLMEKFAGYGFNKSHSAAYAVISYQTAWLKAHYPAEFMAAVLSSDMDKTEKVVGFIDETRRMGLKILPPDINRSESHFVATDEGDIVYGMSAVKGIGDSAVEKIISERNAAGKFSSLQDFISRVNPTKRVVQAAIKSGLLDCLGETRATLMENHERIAKVVKAAKKKADVAIDDMFGGALNDASLVSLDPSEPWSERFKLTGERETLGLYLTGHPIKAFEDELSLFSSGKLSDLCDGMTEDPSESQEDGEVRKEEVVVTVAGVIIDSDVRVNKRGHTAFLKFDDNSRQIQVNVFSKTYDQCMHHLKPDEVLVVEGRLRKDRRTDQEVIVAYNIEPFSMVREKRLSHFKVMTNTVDWSEGQSALLKRLLDGAEKGGSSIVAEFEDSGKELPVGSYRIRPTESFGLALKEIFGDENVVACYRSNRAEVKVEEPKAKSKNPLDIQRHGSKENMDYDAVQDVEWASLVEEAKALMCG